MNILIIGSGGREHTLSWKIKQSKHCDQLFILPGNAGTTKLGENINLNPNDFEKVKDLVIEKNIGLVVVGPEEPLVNGIVDYFESQSELKNVKIFGPSKEGAQLEGSKDFSKDFMFRNKIPCANSKTFNTENIEEGFSFLEEISPPYVLKADGLAAGKGVLILDNIKEAKRELNEMLINKKFGEASRSVLIEEFLDGIEVSIFFITDGKGYVLLPEAKDYKRIGDGDKGPNTGGMGAVSPVDFVDEEFMKKVKKNIVERTINGISSEKINYKGFVFAGLMNVNGEPYVIEYNVRMGDPETQAVIPRLKNDLAEIILMCLDGDLGKVSTEFNKGYSTTVILASNGYPENYNKGKKISNIYDDKNSLVFHAGTKFEGEDIISNGGRVLACTGFGSSLNEAIENSYRKVDEILWTDKYFRKDIGKDLI
ncbi:MAG: phosphoribosylamine--glycine ligase [Flammeovirgaceae bacterium]|nr:phosphoribosylamine--glycine ligase [Flammeovirgaceae bacterium]